MSTEPKLTKRERRQARREEQRRVHAEQARRGTLRRYVTYGVVAALIVAVVALAIGPLGGSLGIGAARAQGTQYPDQGQEHVQRGSPRPSYNSNPPTSGPHYPDWARWGVHEQQLPDEQLVHNLEHGGIVVQYNCPAGCPELAAQLRDVVASYPSKVLLAPRPDPTVPYRITLTAWRWLDGFDDLDADRIRAFVAAHKDRGPELVPD